MDVKTNYNSFSTDNNRGQYSPVGGPDKGLVPKEQFDAEVREKELLRRQIEVLQREADESCLTKIFRCCCPCFCKKPLEEIDMNKAPKATSKPPSRSFSEF